MPTLEYLGKRHLGLNIDLEPMGEDLFIPRIDYNEKYPNDGFCVWCRYSNIYFIFRVSGYTIPIDVHTLKNDIIDSILRLTHMGL